MQEAAAAPPADTDSEDEEDQPAKTKFWLASQLRYHLDKALEGLVEHQFDTYYESLRDIRSAVIKRQHSSQKQTKISAFFKPKPQAREPTRPSASSEAGCCFISSVSLEAPQQLFTSNSD